MASFLMRAKSITFWIRLQFLEPIGGSCLTFAISVHSCSEMEGFSQHFHTPCRPTHSLFLPFARAVIFFFFFASDFNLENFALTSICFPWFLLLFPTLANNLETSQESGAQKIIKIIKWTAAPQVQPAEISHEFCIKFCILNSHISSAPQVGGWRQMH